MLAPDSSPEQTEDCIDTFSNLALEGNSIWEIIQTPVMSTKFNSLLRNAQQHLKSC